MIEKIKEIAIKVNGDIILVGFHMYNGEDITISEYEKGVKDFIYSNGLKRIEKKFFVGEFINFKATKHVDEKWIDELKRQGYNTDKLINVES